MDNLSTGDAFDIITLQEHLEEKRKQLSNLQTIHMIDAQNWEKKANIFFSHQRTLTEEINNIKLQLEIMTHTKSNQEEFLKDF